MRKIIENKKFKFIMNILEGALFSIIGLYLLFVIIQRLGNNISVFGYRVFTVASNSMKPVYVINDVVVVKDVDVDELKVGDDIAYNGSRGGLEGKLVSHRIIKIERGEQQTIFYTQGVNNDYPDPAIKDSQIVGKVSGKLPVITQLNHIIKNQFGFFFLIFCPLVLVISLEIAETIIRIKVEKNELIDKSEENDDTIEEKESSKNSKDVVFDEEIL